MLLLFFLQLRLAAAPQCESSDSKYEQHQSPPQIGVDPHALRIHIGVGARRQTEGCQNRADSM